MKILVLLLIIIIGNVFELYSQAIGWSSRYVYQDATPMGIAPDNSGNVYVVFKTNTSLKTVKYNSVGDSLWVKTYIPPQYTPSAIDLQLDISGNVYIVGQTATSSTQDDILLIKYSSNGNLLWTASYNNPSNTNDQAASMDIDPSGNVIVAGNTYIGAVYKLLTVKFSSAGSLLWSKILSPVNSNNVYSRNLKSDASGNIFVTYDYRNFSNQYFWAILKYNANGDTLWLRQNTSNFGAIDSKVDRNGNLLIAGFSGSGSIDYSIFKYSSTGSLMWSASYNSPTNSDDYTVSLALDTSGNAFITGRSEIDQFNTNTITVKYNSSGTFQWARIYDGQAALSWDYAWDMDVDLAGNVYVLARSVGVSDWDYLTIKYNTNGDSLLVLRSVNGEEEDAQRIAVDNQGGIFVTGVCETSQYAKTIKYLQVPFTAPANLTAAAVSSSKINLTWQENNTLEAGFKIQRSTNAGATWILKDSVGANITAYTDSLLTQNTIYHYRIFAYNLYNNSSYSNVAFDTTFIYVPLPSAPNLISPPNNSSGQSTTPLLDWDTVSAATNYKIQVSVDSLFTSPVYDSTGVVLSQVTVPAGRLNNNTSYFWRVRGRNNGGEGPWSVIWRFTTSLTSITQTGTEIPEVFKLYNNYPNPFNPVTKIKFDIPAVSSNSVPVKIAVYNLLGEEVTLLADKQMQPGSYDVSFDASMYSTGVYFYRIKAGEFTDVKKMILVK